MKPNEAGSLRNGDEVTDYRKTYKVGISPNFPNVVHFWYKKVNVRTIDLKDTISHVDFAFLSKLEKV